MRLLLAAAIGEQKARARADRRRLLRERRARGHNFVLTNASFRARIRAQILLRAFLPSTRFEHSSNHTFSLMKLGIEIYQFFNIPKMLITMLEYEKIKYDKAVKILFAEKVCKRNCVVACFHELALLGARRTICFLNFALKIVFKS